MVRTKKGGLIGQTKHMLNDGAEMAKEKFADARDRAEHYIEDNPKQSVALAAGIGVVVGVTLAFLLMPKRKRFFW
ncbi:MAG: DUF883 family protein [Candidatus Pacearchaeota archaeon]